MTPPSNTIIAVLLGGESQTQSPMIGVAIALTTSQANARRAHSSTELGSDNIPTSSQQIDTMMPNPQVQHHARASAQIAAVCLHVLRSGDFSMPAFYPDVTRVGKRIRPTVGQ